MASIKIEDPNKHILLSLAFTASTHVFRSRVYGLQKPKHIQKKTSYKPTKLQLNSLVQSNQDSYLRPCLVPKKISTVPVTSNLRIHA